MTSKNNQLKKYTINHQDDSFEFGNEFISSFVKREIEVEKISEIQAQKIANKSREVMANFVSTDNVIKKGRIGLLVGQVQSGKTKTFLGVISSSFDYGYDTVVVLSGSDSVLMEQNTKRLTKTFSENDYFKNADIMIEEVSSNEQVESIKSEFESKLAIQRKTKYIFPTLKNRSWLEKLLELLKNTTRKVLIIDDEGDQASHNIENSKKDNASIEEATTINRLITTLVLETENISYLSVTATPYANLVVDSERNLSPNFCVITEPGENYVGLNYFHNGSYKFIELIPDEALVNDEIFIEDIFNNAVSAFVVGNSIIRKTIPSKERNNYEMLIHVDRKIINNESVKEKITNKLMKLKSYINKGPGNLEYEKYFIEDFVINGLTKNDSEWIKHDPDLLKEIIENIELYIEPLSVENIFRGNKIDTTKKKLGDSIYIGANLIERGVTFSQLRVTYMSFTPKQIQGDTLIQRARWFGYRDKDDKQIIFMPQKLIDTYEQLNEGQIDLYGALSQENGLDEIRNEGFPFPFPPTRRTVNINAKFGEITQLVNRQQKLKNEVSSYEDELAIRDQIIDKEQVKEYLDWGHGYVRMDIDKLIEQYPTLLEYVSKKIDGSFANEDICEKLKRMGIKEIDIMFPGHYRKQNERVRKVYDQDVVHIFQGRSNDEDMANMNNYHRPNDRHVLKKSNLIAGDNKHRAQIQIHNILPKNSDGESLDKQIFYALVIDNSEAVKGIIK